jgi:protein-tyrosine phosphatase
MELDDRTIALEGVVNARDIGGLQAADGVVRRGQVLRSASVDGLTPGDVATLRSLGISDVVDLRQPRESTGRLHWFGAGEVTVHALPIGGTVAQLRGIQQKVLSGEVGHFDSGDMADVYMTLLEHYGRTFGTALEVIAGAPSMTLVHCSAGKDRTGLTVALLLLVLGVAPEDVVEDYARSQTHFSDPFMEKVRAEGRTAPADLERIGNYFGAQPETMRAVVEHLSAAGVEHYLRDRAGVSEETLSELRQRLIKNRPDAGGRQRGDHES